MKQVPAVEDLFEDVSELFKIFGDQTRIRILYFLRSEEYTVSAMADKICMTQSAVSHQLSILRKSHLVRCRRDGKNMLYTLADSHVLTILKQGLEHVCESKEGSLLWKEKQN